MNNNWICNHLGARAHYEMPLALHNQGKLKYMLTDVWMDNRHLSRIAPNKFIKKLFQRSNPEIPHFKVKDITLAALSFEIGQKMKKVEGWDLIMNRNNWYQNQISSVLENLEVCETDIFFSFAYTSLKPFDITAKKKLRNILYQMDPGLWEELLVFEEYEKNPALKTGWTKAPNQYWKNWKEELTMADQIIVNSEWSKKALEKIGIHESKIKIVFLPYKIPDSAQYFKRGYPDKFTKDRPMRVLFLGTLTLRKGFHRLLEAAKMLEKEPVEFVLVGEKEFDFENRPNLKVFNHVSRAETIEFYQNSDVFLFPTLSDGFGLTQLEALACKLPVISSLNCGNVVSHGFNGVILEENTSQEIADKVLNLCRNPHILHEMSANTLDSVKRFSHEKFSEILTSV